MQHTARPAWLLIQGKAELGPRDAEKPASPRDGAVVVGSPCSSMLLLPRSKITASQLQCSVR